MKRNTSVTSATRIPSRKSFARSVLGIAMLGALSMASVPATSQAEGRAKRADDTVNAEFFAAMDAGKIDVKFIPKDATKANVLVKNLTDKPLNIKLPAAFAGVPINAQGLGGGGGGFGGGGGGLGGGGGGGGQAVGGGGGGGLGGGGGGGGLGGGGGGFMRVPAERMKKIAFTTVCLEHGKPDPNPKMGYKIVPLEQFSKDENVKVVCEALGNGLLTQNTAQAATWHLTDKLSWEELAKKNRSESKYTGIIRWFSPIELRTAHAAVAEAKRIAESRGTKASEEATKANYDG